MGDRSTAEIRIFGTGATTAFWPEPYGFGPQDLLAVGDVNGDGIDEILQGSASILNEGVVVFDATGAEKSGYGFTYDFAFYDGLAAGDLDGNLGAEIVIGDAGLGFEGGSQVYSPGGTLLASLAGALPRRATAARCRQRPSTRRWHR